MWLIVGHSCLVNGCVRVVQCWGSLCCSDRFLIVHVPRECGLYRLCYHFDLICDESRQVLSECWLMIGTCLERDSFIVTRQSTHFRRAWAQSVQPSPSRYRPIPPPPSSPGWSPTCPYILLAHKRTPDVPSISVRQWIVGSGSDSTEDDSSTVYVRACMYVYACVYAVRGELRWNDSSFFWQSCLVSVICRLMDLYFLHGRKRRRIVVICWFVLLQWWLTRLRRNRVVAMLATLVVPVLFLVSFISSVWADVLCESTSTLRVKR